MSRLILLLLLAPTVALAQARPASPEHRGHAIDPQFSPDGESISYEISNSADKETRLYVWSVAGGREEEIVPPASSSGLGGRFTKKRPVNQELAWAPSGQLHAWSSSGANDDFDVWLRGVTVPLGGEEKQGGAVFSADNRWLVWCSAATGDGDLYLADIYALEKPPVRITTGEGLDFYAAFSPVDSRLAYTAMSEDGSNIRVIEDLTDPSRSDKRITAWKGSSLKPSWSPDGKMLAFFSNHDRQDRTRFDLYVVDSTGGGPKKLVEDVVPTERRGPAWSPDSKGVVVVRNAPNEGDPLVIAGLDGTLQLLPTGTVNNSEPTVFGRAGSASFQVAFVSQGAAGSDEQAWRRVWTVSHRAK